MHVPVNPTFFRQMKHLFFLGDLVVRLVSDGDGVSVGISSVVGVACEEAGRSERGVACTVLPTLCMQAVEREREESNSDCCVNHGTM